MTGPDPTTAKIDQLAQDFGIATPEAKLEAALARRENPGGQRTVESEPGRPVTPFQVSCVLQRIREFVAQGFTGAEAHIILLMRGSRIEALAAAADYGVEEYAFWIARRLSGTNADRRLYLADMSQRNIRIDHHVR